MNRVEFGNLIASLRKEHDDESGLRWTQARLAEEANSAAGTELFTEQIVGTIERGRRSLEENVLVALATALQLTSGERKEFFLAASGVENGRLAREDNDPGEVLNQLSDRMDQICLPSFIVDAYYDVVASTPAMIELLGLESAGLALGYQNNDRFPYNMVKLVFSEPEHREEYFGARAPESWPNVLYETMRAFRAVSLRYRSTEYFQGLLEELKRSLLFRRYWRDVYFHEKDHFVDSRRIQFDSPRWGLLTWFYWELPALTSAGELLLCVCVPASHDTVQAFELIVQQDGATKPVRLACWPDKVVP